MVNKKCIIRLSRYKNALTRLKAFGFVKVFRESADAAGVTSFLRKDFSCSELPETEEGAIMLTKIGRILKFWVKMRFKRWR